MSREEANSRDNCQPSIRRTRRVCSSSISSSFRQWRECLQKKRSRTHTHSRKKKEKPDVFFFSVVGHQVSEVIRASWRHCYGCTPNATTSCLLTTQLVKKCSLKPGAQVSQMRRTMTEWFAHVLFGKGKERKEMGERRARRRLPHVLPGRVTDPDWLFQFHRWSHRERGASLYTYCICGTERKTTGQRERRFLFPHMRRKRDWNPWRCVQVRLQFVRPDWRSENGQVWRYRDLVHSIVGQWYLEIYISMEK